MDESFNIQRLLTLRKLTRAISDLLRGQMKDYLSTLAPLLRPRAVLGDYVQSSTKEPGRAADKAFQELQALYTSVVSAKPFNLPAELKPPIEIISTTLEMTQLDYPHEAKTEQATKTVVVTAPLKWVLTYSGFAPARLKEMLVGRSRPSEQIQQYVLHYCVMNIVLAKQQGVTEILNALHFPITTHRWPEFGELPITYISADVSTARPPDSVIIESTEVSGRDAFEEVVRLGDIVSMSDPLKERLIELVRSHGEELPDF